MYVLAPSILSADFANLGRDVEQITKAGASYVHIDVMDGQFVPNISFGMPIMKAIRPLTDQTFDVHLMIEEPGRYIKEFKEAGADLICVHQEACTHLNRTIAQIKELGLKAAVALNPATPICTLEHVIEELDMVLIMSVNPGFGGQKFIPNTLQKVKMLREMADQKGLKQLDIQVDGGVTLENAKSILEAGANILVAGSAVFKGDAKENVEKFLTIFKEGI
ncbi:MAG: ribulose-phosphate 3-epimerase [Lachnospiraceae bacterium]|nr:ribulose-phosphate 3-epimerase [Lachnospiraceae bacterium]MEE1341916.1 ribulose-phosphate 3-epimerase [Lachnospiraceae bacterium]